MNATTGSRITQVALAMIWLAACDNPLTAPFQPPGEVLSEAVSEALKATSATETTQSLAASALGSASGNFHIEIVPIDAGSETLLPTLRVAAGRWIQILRQTELPDMQFGEGPKPDCIGLRLDNGARVVDDLAILVSVRTMDGPGGMLAMSGPCWVRWESSLPYLGGLILDRADVAALDAQDLRDLIAHEIGHVLGIGVLWGNFGFLRNPSLFAPGADTHFTGTLAVGAFDAAGGSGYLHGKVPVENLMGPGSSDVHWRESVLATELMTPVLVRGESHPLSAVTIQSLSDLGYTVDPATADEYTVPVPGHGGGSNGLNSDLSLSLAGDVEMGPLLSVDPEGRVVEVPRR